MRSAVENVFDSYEVMLYQQLSAQCSDPCIGQAAVNFNAHDFDQDYDVTFESSALLPIGNGQLFNQGSCSGIMDCGSTNWTGTCQLRFYIRDWFQDPYDFFDVIPGTYDPGTPYRIWGDWDENRNY